MTSIEISKEVKHLINNLKDYNETIDAFLKKILTSLSDDESQRRILFIGPPAAGKTSIRCSFFEDIKPQTLIETPPEPTRGLENYTYNWLDVTVGIADSSGQEFERWVNYDAEYAFRESDSIIFVVDTDKFEEDKKEVLDQIEKALISKNKNAPKAQFNIFLHKIDLIDEKEREESINSIKSAVKTSLKEKNLKTDMVLIKFYYTSIKGELILGLVKSMRSVLYSYSKIMRRSLIPYSLRM